MWELIRKYKVAVGTGTVLLAAFVFFSLNLRNKEQENPVERVALSLFSPLFSVATWVNDAVGGVWSSYLDLVHVRRENKRLQEAVRELNGQLAANREALQANERLRRLLDLKSSLQVPSLAATVIGEDGSPWFKTVVIDRGEADGLREGLPVVAADGVVGHLIKVSAHSSRVLLFTDHASAIAATIQRSRARGVVKGKGGGRCALEFTMREEDVKVGDAVVTSGIGGIFPKGISIGEVTMVRRGEYGIFQTIEIRPAVNLSRLEEVLVLVLPKLP